MEPIRHDGAMTARSSVGGEPADAHVRIPVVPAPDDRRAQPRDRRMHLRAYNCWASMLDRRRFPSVADLAKGILGDIAAHSVLLDVSAPAQVPAIAYLGERLAAECGAGEGTLQRLCDAPEGSLLARLDAHYETVLLNRAPTGFEAAFTGLRGAMVLYRGILLPFSSDDATIDFVLAVMNWKEESESARELREPGQPLAACRRTPSTAALLTDWADGPGSSPGDAPDLLFTDAAQPTDLTKHMLSCEEVLLDSEAQDFTLPMELVDRLRTLLPQPITALSSFGPEFALAIIRRQPGEAPALLGEVPQDAALMEKAAQLLAG